MYPKILVNKYLKINSYWKIFVYIMIAIPDGPLQWYVMVMRWNLNIVVDLDGPPSGPFGVGFRVHIKEIEGKKVGQYVSIRHYSVFL